MADLPIELEFRIENFGAPRELHIIEVAARGPAVEDLVAHSRFKSKLDKRGVTGRDWVLLGNLDKQGHWFGEWDLELDIDREWIVAQIPESVKKEAWGERMLSNPTVDLDTFYDAYVEAALWSSTDESTPSGGYPLDKNYGPDDFTRDAQKKMRHDADAFARAHASLIAGRESQAGHDFWLTRNRHGAGFWDGDWPEPAATILTDAAHAFGEQNISVYRKRLHVESYADNAGRPQRKKRKPLPKWLAEQIREADQAVQEAEDELGDAENSGYQERIRDAEEAVETAYEDRDQLWDQAEKWEDTHAALLSNPTGAEVAAIAAGVAVLGFAAWWLFRPKTTQATTATPICFNNESGLRECYSAPLSDTAKARLQQIYPNASPELKAAIDAALKQTPSTTYGVDPASMFMI